MKTFKQLSPAQQKLAKRIGERDVYFYSYRRGVPSYYSIVGGDHWGVNKKTLRALRNVGWINRALCDSVVYRLTGEALEQLKQN